MACYVFGYPINCWLLLILIILGWAIWQIYNLITNQGKEKCNCRWGACFGKSCRDTNCKRTGSGCGWFLMQPCTKRCV